MRKTRSLSGKRAPAKRKADAIERALSESQAPTSEHVVPSVEDEPPSAKQAKPQEREQISCPVCGKRRATADPRARAVSQQSIDLAASDLTASNETERTSHVNACLGIVGNGPLFCLQSHTLVGSLFRNPRCNNVNPLKRRMLTKQQQQPTAQ